MEAMLGSGLVTRDGEMAFHGGNRGSKRADGRMLVRMQLQSQLPLVQFAVDEASL